MSPAGPAKSVIRFRLEAERLMVSCCQSLPMWPITTQSTTKIQLALWGNLCKKSRDRRPRCSASIAVHIETVVRIGLSVNARPGSRWSIAAEYHGATLTIDLRDGDRKTYRLDPCAKSKKEAKEAACRLAVRSGIKTDLLAQKRLVDATRITLNRLNPMPGTSGSTAPPKPGAVTPDEVDYLEKSVPYLYLGILLTNKSVALLHTSTYLCKHSPRSRTPCASNIPNLHRAVPLVAAWAPNLGVR